MRRAEWLIARPWRPVVLVLLVVLPLLVVGELAAADTVAQHEAAVRDSAKRASANAAASFADRVSGVSRAIGNAAIRPTTGRPTPLVEAIDASDAAAVQRELEGIHRSIDPAVQQLLILDGSSRVVAVDPFTGGFVGTDLSARPYAARGLGALEVGDAFAELVTLGVGRGSTYINLSVSAPIGTSRPIGYRLVALVRLSVLAGPILSQLRASYKDAYLLDRSGRLALRASRAFSQDDRRLQDLSGTSASTPTTGSIADPLDADRLVLGIGQAPGIGWSVVIVDAPAAVTGDLDAALAQQRALRLGLAGVLLVGAALVGIASSTAIRRRRETAEALEQQTATSEVLKTISRSAFDLQSVFNVVVENATKLCRGDWGYLFRREGDVFRLVASHGGSAALVEYERAHPTAITRRTLIGRVALDRHVVHIPDTFEDAEYDWPSNREHGVHTILGVPIMRNDEVVGAIGVARNERRPFFDAEVRLVQTFADQAAIAIENVRLFNETKESLERQTALAGILRVIATSTSDETPVLDAIAENAARYCGAQDALVLLVDGGELVLVAHHGPIATLTDSRIPLRREAVGGRAVIERHTLHIADILDTSADDLTDSRARATETGIRGYLASPLLRQGDAIGLILLRKNEPTGFAASQIALVEAFAAQAVVAIENVRLFNETKEALGQQTATADVLKTINRSAFDLQAVFDAVVENALSLCRGDFSYLYRRDGDVFRIVASRGGTPALVEYEYAHPTPIRDKTTLMGRVVLERNVVHIPDLFEDPDYEWPSNREAGVHTVLGVPIFKDTEVVGAIGVARNETSPFSEAEIRLVSTFADQAAIAMENVRLFNETKESLERQTAISDVLQTIGRSAFDLQPVLDTVVERAVKLCDAREGSISMLEEGVYRTRAHWSAHPLSPEYVDFMRNEVRTPERGSLVGRTALEGRVVRIPDALEDPEYKATEMQQAGGYRTLLGVPLLRDAKVIGVFALTRSEVRPFSDRQIDLIRTFADQAAIAIENTRLFAATKEALEQQTAVGDVLKTISRSAFDLQPVLDIVLNNAVRLAGADIGWLSRVEGDRFTTVAYSNEFPQAVIEELRRQRTDGHLAGPWVPIGQRGGVMGFTLAEGQTIHLPDVREDENLKDSVVVRLTNTRTVVGVPMLRDGHSIGGMVLARYEVRPLSEREIELVETFADQAAIAIGNVRLFNEIQDKSRQLETASRHKSEFLANMSHELRTPLNAIIGFSEVLLQGIFGDVNDKQREYLQDVLGSGQHLLSLINDILDLSKIEAGRMDLEISSFAVRDALESGLTIVRERAARHGVQLKAVVAPDVGAIEADERKVKQILYNLLSNAVKFTPDGGRVDVGVSSENGDVRVEVRDTGIGVAPEDQERIFEEFRQVGRERSREGTGLGLTLTKRFVELHGGRIWLDSTPGKGSTFTFTLPLQRTATVSG